MNAAARTLANITATAVLSAAALETIPRGTVIAYLDTLPDAVCDRATRALADAYGARIGDAHGATRDPRGTVEDLDSRNFGLVDLLPLFAAARARIF